MTRSWVLWLSLGLLGTHAPYPMVAPSASFFTTPIMGNHSGRNGSLLSTAEWNVDCGHNMACNSEYPICCTGDNYNPYCIAGGRHCCAGADPEFNGCRLNETCCSGTKDGHAVLECCDSSSNCEWSDEKGHAHCVKDTCREHTSQDQCVGSGGCGWCCGTNTCQSERWNCDDEPQCEKDRTCQWITNTSKYSECPDPCGEILDCDECRHTVRAGQGCGWCCSTGRCSSIMNVGSGAEKCSLYSWIPPTIGAQPSPLQCSACQEGGKGLYHIQSIVVMVLCSVILPLFIVLLMVALFFKRCNGGLGYSALNTDDEDDEEDGGGRRRTTVKVTKYGFGDEDEDDDSQTSSDAGARKTPESRCPLCMTNAPNVVFLPCYHCYCCSECSCRLEKLSCKDTQGKMLCPFCRQGIETMVNLDKVFKLGDKGPAVASSSQGAPGTLANNEESTPFSPWSCVTPQTRGEEAQSSSLASSSQAGEAASTQAYTLAGVALAEASSATDDGSTAADICPADPEQEAPLAEAEGASVEAEAVSEVTDSAPAETDATLAEAETTSETGSTSPETDNGSAAVPGPEDSS